METITGFSELVLGPTLVLLAAGLVVLALRPFSASARHLAWTAGLLGALLVPLAGTFGPDLPVSASGRIAGFVEGEPFAAESTPRPAASAADPAGGGVAATSGGDGGSFASSVPWRAVWLTGFLAALVLLSLRLFGLRRISASSTAPPPVLVDALDAARERLGVDRSVGLLVGDGSAMPMTWGVLRPRILLASAVTTWPAEQLDAVLLHELAHVRRHDVALQRIGEIARAVLWFNPLAWIAVRQMLVEREHACDDTVLRAGVRGSEYAHQLLGMANSLRSTGAAAGLPMARKSQMTGRLLAILDERRVRREVGRSGTAVALGLGVAAALFVAAVRPVAAESEPGANQPSAVERVAEPSDAGCWHPSENGNSNTNHDPGLITAEVRTTRCFIFLRIAGYAILRPDTTGFSWLEPGGRISISETQGSRERELVLRGGSSGEVQLAGTEHGAALAPPEIQAWLAENLRPLLRKTRVHLEVGLGP